MESESEVHRSNRYTVVQQLALQRTLVRLADGQLAVYRCARFEECDADGIVPEVKLLESLDHLNIVKILECHLTTDGIDIVEEYYEEGSLADHIHEEFINPEKTMKGIVQGISYLHNTKRLPHLRLSLHSIFLMQGRVVISDVFRLSHPISQAAEVICQPPELAQGVYGYSTDIWSLGVVFLEILLKRKLDNATNLTECMGSVTDQQYRQLIRRMLHPSPQMRPSINKVLEDLSERSENIISNVMLIDKIVARLDDFWMCKISQSKISKLQRESMNMIESEAVKGNPRAMFLMGRSFQTEEEYTDIPKAKQWFHKAAEAGEARAYTNLFNCYSSEGNVDVNYLQRGVQLNDNRSRWTLARKLGYGFCNVPVDIKKALQLFNTAEKYTKSEFDIGAITSKIENSQTIFAAGYKHLYKKGAEKGDRRAIEALSSCTSNQNRHKEAIKLGLIAAKIEGGCIGSQHHLFNRIGVSYGGVKDTLARKRWFVKAISIGNTTASKNMAKVGLFH